LTSAHHAGGPRAPPADLLADPRVIALTGDLNDLLPAAAPGWMRTPTWCSIWRLQSAANARLILTSACAVTLAPRCPAGGLPRPQDQTDCGVCQFTGGVWRCAGVPLPPVIEDNTLPTPQSSYGIQKLIGNN